ncbi:MAG: serine/threonine protein kinase [Sandaracinaceae bacterium]|nr:serine/threonine protein kinase [Sandaracinaceae bacterium]
MLAIGSKLRDYEIVAHLRSGGMASLFLGRRQGPDGFARLVAIKVVHADLSHDPGFVRMFVDEAKISSRIDHPNVVHVEELGEAYGTKFLVMEYVHGVSLAQLLGQLVTQGRRLTPKLATHIAVRIAEGLHAAHETRGDDGQLLNIVHRDVSPQNVLVAANGHIKLIDFGIAKARGRSQDTTTTQLKGKIRYMSPEQAYGKEVDRRCDVYALGVVFWEMLTARRMHADASDLALLDMVRSPAIVAPSQLNPNVSPELDAVVMAALAPNVGDRIPTTQELRRRLADAMPSALTLDASSLADLLDAVMGEELTRQRDRIHASAREQLVTSIFPRATGSQVLSMDSLTSVDAGISPAHAPAAWAEAVSDATFIPTPTRYVMPGSSPPDRQATQPRTPVKWILALAAVPSLGRWGARRGDRLSANAHGWACGAALASTLPVTPCIAA